MSVQTEAWTLGFTCLTDSLQATGYETSFIWVVEMFLNENRVPQKFYGVSSLSNWGVIPHFQLPWGRRLEGCAHHIIAKGHALGSSAVFIGMSSV